MIDTINNQAEQKGVIVLTGISGSGKTTLSKAFGVEHTIVSYTSRDPRPGEIEGEDYYFLNEEEAIEASKTSFERAEFDGNYYGITFDEIEKKTNNYQDLAILVANSEFYSGVRSFRGKLYFEGVLVYPVILNVPEDVAVERIKARGGSEDEIVSRTTKILQEKEQVEIVRDLFDIPEFTVDTNKEIPENQSRFLKFLQETYNLDV